MKWIFEHPRKFVALLGLIVLGSALGRRFPEHIDEVRFVGVALEMLQSGNWLVPHRVGEIYADKPPIFFWLLASMFELTHSVRWGFLLPGLISGVACLLLVFDLGKRWWNLRVGLCAAILLLASYQFWRICTTAHIDSFLVLCTTLGVYGFARHMLSGRDPAWFVAGFIAVSIGILSKGVGFLPLLLIIPFVFLRLRGRLQISIPARQWLTGIAIMLGLLLCWLLPLLVRSHSDIEIRNYLDNILLQQTAQRYANAWQHREPFWFFAANIPKYWAPLSLLLPWLIPTWYRRLRRNDPRYVLLLSWVALVLLFFSASTGKRELYILPALPITALAAAPTVLLLIRKQWMQRSAMAATWILIGVSLVAAATIIFELLPESRIASWPSSAGWWLLAMAALATVAALGLRKRANPAIAAMVCYGLLIIFYHRALLPLLDEAESGHAAMRELSASVTPASIALIEWDERNWLYSTVPLLHNGIHVDSGRNLCSTSDTPLQWLMSAEQAEKLGLPAKNTFSLQRKKFTVMVEPTTAGCSKLTPFVYHFQWNADSLRILDK